MLFEINPTASYEKMGRMAALVLGYLPDALGKAQIEALGYEAKRRTGTRKPLTESIALEALVIVMRRFGGVR
jgi:hypothetical protein